MDLLKTQRFKSIIVFILTLFAMLILDYILLFVFTYCFYNSSIKDVPIVFYYLAMILKYLLIIIFYLFYYKNYLKEKWKDFRLNFKKYFKIAFNDWIIGFIIMYVSNIFIMRIIGTPGQNEETVQKLISYTPMFAFLLTTILAPIVEEMVFRKSLKDCFKNKIIFMIVSGFLFGFVHVMGSSSYLEYLLIIPYGALGVSFAHTLNETDNIYPTIMMHAIHNGFLTLLSIMVNL